MKLAGDPNNPLRVRDNATAEELPTEVMRRLGELTEAGVIDLTALPPPKRGIANYWGAVLFGLLVPCSHQVLTGRGWQVGEPISGPT